MAIPEVVGGMDQIGPEAADMIGQSPMGELYRGSAATGGLAGARRQDGGDAANRLRLGSRVGAMTTPTLVVFADADSIRPDHIIEFYGLLGGGRQEGGVDGSGGRRPSSRCCRG